MYVSYRTLRSPAARWQTSEGEAPRWGTGKFRDKSVVVTGGGSGFGRAAAARFADEGARVAVVEIDAAAARATAGDLGPAALALRADVSAPDNMQAMAARVLDEFGAVDVIFANAGIEGPGTAANLSVDDWQRVIGVNLTGGWLTSKFLLPSMIERGSGAIVNTASIGGLVGVRESFPYAAAKGG